MAKPTSPLGWATNVVNETVTIGVDDVLVTNKVEPTQELKDSGVLAREPWSRPYLNFLFDYIMRWLGHLNTEGIATYDAITDYPVQGLAKGSDGNVYEVRIANGPTTTVVNPVGDATGTWVLAFMGLGKGPELTIATGVIAVTKRYHDVDTEADAATDDLATINGGIDGMELVLRANDAARTVVVKDATGNLQLAGDFSLDNTQDTIKLIFDSTLNAWLELSRSGNGA